MRKIKSRSASGPPRFFVCVPCPARRAQGVIIEGIKPSGKTQTFPPHIQRRRAFPASLSVAGLTGIFPFSPLLSLTFPLCPPGGGKGPVMGALPPFEAPFQTPESPPLPRAEASVFTARLFQQKLRFRNRRAHTSIPVCGAA